MWKKYKKIIVVVLGFLLITAPGAIDSWLSLIQRLRGNEAVNINLSSWHDIYSVVFPILGLAVIVWGLWWTRPEKETLSQTFPKTKTKVPNSIILTAEQQALLNFYEQQKANWGQYISIEITDIICYTKVTTPYLVFRFKVRNFLPISFKIVRINADGTLNSGKVGNLPSIKENIDGQFRPCGESEFNLKLQINGTGIPAMLETASGNTVQWIIQGEWYIEIYGENRKWRSDLMFSQVPKLMLGN